MFVTVYPEMMSNPGQRRVVLLPRHLRKLFGERFKAFKAEVEHVAGALEGLRAGSAEAAHGSFEAIFHVRVPTTSASRLYAPAFSPRVAMKL